MEQNDWNDFEKLDLFAREAESLGNARLIEDKFEFGVTIEKNPFGSRVEEYGMDDEQLRAFLSKLRPFLSSDEPIFLYSIYNIAEKLVLHDKAREYIIKSRNEWKEQRKNPFVRFIFDKKRINNENIVDWWMNGFYFHHDREKKMNIERMPDAVRALTKFDFLSSVITAAGHVLWVGGNLRFALTKGFVGHRIQADS
jgi:hypothetical protein